MTDRADAIAQFLAQTPWRNATQRRLTGDASTRGYLRLGPNGAGIPAILMDADPTRGNDVRPFQKMTDYLRSLALSAPQIYASDPERGFLLLEDLGDALFARVVEAAPAEEETLYLAATDVLLYQHAQVQPDLPAYDTALMTDRALLAYDWYLAHAGDTADLSGREAFEAAISALLDTEITGPRVLIQRDYHAENLLWLPDRTGLARVGLLDYQDALLGHPAYDLVSLLQDARRDVPQAIETQMIAHYIAKAGCDASAFTRAYHLLGLQRNLRILGVFARLSLHYGKAHYVDLIPRVWGFITRDLEQDVNAPVAQMLRDHLPIPSPEILTRLKDKCATIPDL